MNSLLQTAHKYGVKITTVTEQCTKVYGNVDINDIKENDKNESSDNDQSNEDNDPGDEKIDNANDGYNTDDDEKIESSDTDEVVSPIDPSNLLDEVKKFQCHLNIYYYRLLTLFVFLENGFPYPDDFKVQYFC